MYTIDACWTLCAGTDVPFAAPKPAASVGTPAAPAMPPKESYSNDEGECHFVSALRVGVDGAFEVPNPGSSLEGKGTPSSSPHTTLGGDFMLLRGHALTSPCVTCLAHAVSGWYCGDVWQTRQTGRCSTTSA